MMHCKVPWNSTGYSLPIWILYY